MVPLTLSASAVQTFLDCPAKFKAQSIEKADDLSGSAASLGTACHQAIQSWVEFEHHKGTYTDDWSVMKAFWDEAYWALFSDAKRYTEGMNLLKKWLARQDWSDREVVSTENKQFFMLPFSGGTIKFNYIMDRLDKRKRDGAPEVIDYKTLSQPVQPSDLKRKVQSRVYALAAQLLYPTAERVWVTFDMLRYDSVGVVFTKEENRATWLFLKKVAEDIFASDGSAETINEGCRWCIRKTICKTLNNHAIHGGTLALTDPVIAAERYFTLQNQIGGLKTAADDLEKVVLAWMKEQDTDTLDTPNLDVKVGVSGRRHIDPERLATIIGPDVMLKYSNINVTSVDEIIRTENLTDAQKSLVRQMFTTTYSEPGLKIKPKGPF